MSDSEKPKRPHPDVLAPGEAAPAPKFSDAPVGAPPAKEIETGSAKALLAGMTPVERDAFFRDLLKSRTPEEIGRLYGVTESYLAVVADEEDSE